MTLSYTYICVPFLGFEWLDHLWLIALFDPGSVLSRAAIQPPVQLVFLIVINLQLRISVSQSVTYCLKRDCSENLT